MDTSIAGWLNLSHGGAWNFLSSTSNQFLSLSYTSTSISLDAFESFSGMLAGEIFDLVGLSTDHTGCVVDSFIDELLVLNVDQWRKEEDGSAEQCQAPDRQELHEVVRDEGRREPLQEISANVFNRLDFGFSEFTHENCHSRILGEQDSLKLDDEKVNELLDIIQCSLEGLLRNLVVSARAESSGNALTHDEFAADFSKSGDCITWSDSGDRRY